MEFKVILLKWYKELKIKKVKFSENRCNVQHTKPEQIIKANGKELVKVQFWYIVCHKNPELFWYIIFNVHVLLAFLRNMVSAISVAETKTKVEVLYKAFVLDLVLGCILHKE